jgi:ketosteroid isomerase-like protein
MGSRIALKDIEKLEESLRVAMESSDVDALDKLISSKLLFTNHFGRTITKDDDLLLHKSGELNIESISLSDMVVEDLGDSVAVSVRAKIVSTFQSSNRSTDFRFTRVWTQEEGRWVVAVGHSCIVAN